MANQNLLEKMEIWKMKPLSQTLYFGCCLIFYDQAIPGYMLLIMPIVYGVTGTPPFVTR